MERSNTKFVQELQGGGRALCLREKKLRVRACFMLARVPTPTLPVRERERERVVELGCRICPELLFLFLKGMTGVLAPFSCLVK